MKNLKLFLLTIYFLSLIKTECGQGCFSCQKNECFICNHFQNYYLDISQNKCIKKYIPNCQKMLDGHCLECKTQFIYKITNEEEGGECIKISTKIENCLNYKNTNSCKNCNPGYYSYQNGQKCIPYKKKIENCKNYYRTQKNEIKCNLCENGFLLNKEQNLCSKYQKDKNCLISSNFYCKKCDKGYSLENDLFNNRVKGPNLYEWVNDILVVEEEPYRQTSTIKCSSLIENCKNFNDFEIEEKKIVKCVECFPGYFLKKVTEFVSKCFLAQEIINCEVYENENSCKFCKRGFFLRDGVCTQVGKVIRNCEVYESEGKCGICLEEFELVNEDKGKEIARDVVLLENLLKSFFSFVGNENEKEIEHHQKLKENIFEMLNKEWIENLNLNFNLKNLLQNNTPNERELLEIQEQVIIKEKKNEETQKFLKFLTKSGLPKPQCLKTSKNHCKTYKNGFCTSCQDNYYLLEENCVQIKQENTITNCISYNSSQNCQNCKNGFILHFNNCFKMNPIYNCEEKIFDENGQCILCKSGFYYDHEIGKCVVFKEMEEKNCLIFSDLQSKSCYLCNKGHYMDNQENCMFQDDLEVNGITGRLANHRRMLV